MFHDYHRTIVGYHGTSKDRAERIVRDQRFEPSRNNYDWLGQGVYFWEYAPKQALAWARRKHRKDAAVVASMLRLGNCLDLLDPENARALKKFHDSLESEALANNQVMPRNRNARKLRDHYVLEAFYQREAQLIRESNAKVQSIQTSRGVYVATSGTTTDRDSGHRLWERSWLTLDAHIQICVREHAINHCIIGTWPVR